MSDRNPFGDTPTDTRERMMHATYRALQRHGYAGLSLQRIADESDLSKSAVYHFYDDKEDLLIAFLDFMLDRFQEEFELAEGDDPAADLRAYVEHAVRDSPPPTDTPEDRTAYVPFGPVIELRAQAVRNEAFRERFTDLDAMFEAELASIVERGVERGVFREVDPDHAASLLLTFLAGAMMRRATVEDVDTEALMAEADAVLERYLAAEEADGSV